MCSPAPAAGAIRSSAIRPRCCSDVRNELLSAAKAAADYGVVVDTARWTVDAAATARRRARDPASARLARGARRCNGTIRCRAARAAE